jgi:tetratricopeptide (TPR) repeat protein
MDAIRLEQMRSLPRRDDEIWQGALVRMSSWVTEGDSEPFRPYLPIWHAVRDDKIHCIELLRPSRRNFRALISSLLDFALDSQFGGYRPGTIQVTDAALAEHLQGVLAECGIAVQHLPKLNELDNVVAELRRENEAEAWAPPLLSDTGISIEQLRAFAEAADRYYRARPWELLTDIDPIRVEKPAAPKGMRYAVVLGAAQDPCGLGMYASNAEVERARCGQLDLQLAALWQVSYGPLHRLPVEDAELWEDHNLPVSADDAYPLALRVGPGSTFTRPNRSELAFLEGLLLTIADASEEEIDSGHWERHVPAQRRSRLFRLSIPNLIRPPSMQKWIHWGFIPDSRIMERSFLQAEQCAHQPSGAHLNEMAEVLQNRSVGRRIDSHASSPTTPKQRALDLCYQAYETFGRRRVQLARQALEIDPDCADALVLRAEQAATGGRRLDFYQRGIAAAERQLGKSCFHNDEGIFWQIPSTRTYMRARFGAAQVLEQLGDFDAAIAHYQDLLRLNPDDHQGTRYVLLPLLLSLGRDVEAAAILKRFDESTASWAYAKALLVYRLSGRSSAAATEARSAFQLNAHFPSLLEEDDRSLPLPPFYSQGSVEEAEFCLTELGDAYRNTDGAKDWLLDEVANWERESHEHQRLKRPDKKSRSRKNRKR